MTIFTWCTWIICSQFQFIFSNSLKTIEPEIIDKKKKTVIWGNISSAKELSIGGINWKYIQSVVCATTPNQYNAIWKSSTKMNHFTDCSSLFEPVSPGSNSLVSYLVNVQRRVARGEPIYAGDSCYKNCKVSAVTKRKEKSNAHKADMSTTSIVKKHNAR